MMTNTNQKPVLIMAGGTGGHIFPGLAVARELQARDVPVAWLGSSHGLETKLVPQAGIALHTISISGLRGKGLLTLLTAPLRIVRACLQALRVLRRVQPCAVLSMGGFAAGPGGLMARFVGLPLIVHEQNRVAGVTNKILAMFARRVCTGFSQTRGLSKAQVVGNPVRAEIANLSNPEIRFSQRNGKIRILVMGGSLGARTINQVVPAALKEFEVDQFEIRHQCGPTQIEVTRAHYASHNIKSLVDGFIEDMAEALGWADLVICRAGALTLAELCAAGVGAILIPYPHAVDDHQMINASELSDAGGAIVLAESTFTPTQLAVQLRLLFQDRKTLFAMAKAARKLARIDASTRVADIILQEARA